MKEHDCACSEEAQQIEFRKSCSCLQSLCPVEPSRLATLYCVGQHLRLPWDELPIRRWEATRSGRGNDMRKARREAYCFQCALACQSSLARCSRDQLQAT